ncbi:hypothetical protein P7D50_12860 [Enterococcus dongliensis]|uniref:hypothetical protein n=1 Tax=Enterococcus dongliensis TaxID=2559925 RepID=UPI00288FDFC5|nr:hypothetical protein [Enterococcus dongliensis]
MVDYWNDCFNDLHILQPDWKTIERTSDRAMVFMLLNDEEEWGKLERRTKNKYKKLVLVSNLRQLFVETEIN